MRWRIAVLAMVGVAAVVLLVGHYGVEAVTGALAVAGWRGFALVVAFNLLPLALCGLAWRALLRPPPASGAAFFLFRLVRYAGSLLPPSGPVLGIRAMGLAGIDLDLAVASTLVDNTIEMASQVVFTLAGVIVLISARAGGTIIGSAFAALAILIALVAGFVLLQHYDLLRLLPRLSERGWSALARVTGIQDRIRAIYADRSGLGRAFVLHLLAWFVSVGEGGIALYLLGHPLGAAPLLALESLSYALRGVSFFIPASAGIQEGGYVLLGGLFGLPPEIALALSLLKRGRELLLAALGFVTWQAMEHALGGRNRRPVGEPPVRKVGPRRRP